jgi:superfamily I DNA/RNA helicase
VIAGAGSGKTSTLAHRVAQIVSQGTDPGRILLLTFSRRAASEMTRRVERILSRRTRAARSRPRPRWPGPAPSTASARACCASTPAALVSIRRSPSMTDRTRPT